MAFNRKNGFERSDDTTFFFSDFVDDFSQDSSFFNENGINSGKHEFHQFSIGVETLDDIKEGIDDGFGVIVDFFALNSFIFLSDA